MAGLGSQLQNIGTAMAGFSAGLQGQLPQFQQVQQQKLAQEQEQMRYQQEQRQKMVEERQKTMYTDANAALQLLKMGNLDGVVQLGVNRLQGLQQLSQQFPDIDPSDTQRVTQLAIAARNGDEEALELLTGELESAVQVGQAIGVLAAPKAPQGATELGKLKQDLDAGLITQEQYDLAAKPEEGFELISADEAARLNLPENGIFQRNKGTQQISQVGGSGVTVNNISGAQNSYLQGRAGQQATAMGELEKGAESAFRANMALDRFLASSPEGDAGGAQPVLTGVKNLLSTFGFDPAGLTDTAKMEQAIGDILGQKMAELGARGLTDRDMDVLRQALPRVNTSKEARQNVAGIIKKANEFTLNEYINQVKWEEENYPDFTFRRPSWLNEYRANVDATNQDDPLGILK